MTCTFGCDSAYMYFLSNRQTMKADFFQLLIKRIVFWRIKLALPCPAWLYPICVRSEAIQQIQPVFCCQSYIDYLPIFNPRSCDLNWRLVHSDGFGWEDGLRVSLDATILSIFLNLLIFFTLNVIFHNYLYCEIAKLWKYLFGILKVYGHQNLFVHCGGATSHAVLKCVRRIGRMAAWQFSLSLYHQILSPSAVHTSMLWWCTVLFSSIRTVNNAFFDPYTGKEADKFQAYRGIVVTWEKMKLKNDPTLPNVSLSLSFSVYSLCFRLRSIGCG